MKKTAFYAAVGIAALVASIGFALSQYTDHKQLNLSRQKAIEDCVEKNTNPNLKSGFAAANERNKCEDLYPE